jgi:hypothetical protein
LKNLILHWQKICYFKSNFAFITTNLKTVLTDKKCYFKSIQSFKQIKKIHEYFQFSNICFNLYIYKKTSVFLLATATDCMYPTFNKHTVKSHFFNIFGFLPHSYNIVLGLKKKGLEKGTIIQFSEYVVFHDLRSPGTLLVKRLESQII